MGSDRVTIKNLEIADVKDGEIVIKGLIPGPKNGLVMITKIGENKKFKPLFSIASEEIVEEIVEQAPREEVVEPSDAEVETEEKVEPKEITEPSDAEAMEGKEKSEDSK